MIKYLAAPFIALLLSLPAAAQNADPVTPLPMSPDQPAMSTPLQALPDDAEEHPVLPKPTPSPSKMGDPSGGACKADADCALGCLPKDRAITCYNKTEASDMCLKNRFFIPPEQSCGCLTDIHRCGFLGRDVQHH